MIEEVKDERMRLTVDCKKHGKNQKMVIVSEGFHITSSGFITCAKCDDEHTKKRNEYYKRIHEESLKEQKITKEAEIKKNQKEINEMIMWSLYIISMITINFWLSKTNMNGTLKFMILILFVSFIYVSCFVCEGGKKCQNSMI